ncbi:MAG TPA: hypothetical protein VFW65_32005 [Pseudonocardiaceae bacterium]|nr:hypothetical protein [Pseudonocardiaceae bacterium]
MSTEDHAQPSTEPEPALERWVFGGSRVGSKDQRVHAWIDSSGDELWYAPKGHPTIGCVYEVMVTRTDKRIARGAPSFTGQQSEDTELVDRLSALHRAAEVDLSMRARERAVKRDDPIEQAIGRLAELARNVPANQRTAFAAYVTVRLLRGWK